MKQNLGVLERLIRPLLGIIAIAVVLEQPQFGLSEGIVLLLAIFLILNGITARCYLWRWLGINTARDRNCEWNDPRED